MIGVDWGTSSFRAYRMAADGNVLERLESPLGIANVVDGDFAGVLRQQVGAWLAAGESRILMSGMIGSRQGWREAPYIPCPANLNAILAGLVSVPFEQADVRLVPGLSDRDSYGVPEVMRGEETQLIGVRAGIAGDALVCLPGSHSKWVRAAAGQILSFNTYLSGEAFAAIRSATILGRTMQQGAADLEAFRRGIDRSGQPGHLLHHLFGVRTLGLTGALGPAASASYLSGLLIGTEIRAALPYGSPVHLIGAASLCALYQVAVVICGGTAQIEEEDAAARGLGRIGSLVWG